ncbi:TetR/AcrR family transcriptional regulator [Propionicicella superfundia]|uniref:TetR/AcrR family transcriptional regulator n=1 Tax=Propionicicella superfundia TaxID=348582 RepID=UPI00146BA4F3|nr:TetR/AcrR family transcriptional regulator [Propionicicella superfundia]
MTPARRRWNRPPLSKDAIVSASLELVDAEGLGALTMRRVADELDVAPMSLYRHVKDRQALLVGMLDAVALAVRPVPRGSSPRGEIGEILRSLHDTFRTHPWVIGVLANDGLASEHIMPLIDQALGCLLRAGLPEKEAARGWGILFHHLVGETLFTHRTGPTYAQTLIRSMDLTQMPSLARLAQSEPRPHSDAVEDSLDLLLDCVLPHEGERPPRGI